MGQPVIIGQNQLYDRFYELDGIFLQLKETARRSNMHVGQISLLTHGCWLSYKRFPVYRYDSPILLDYTPLPGRGVIPGTGELSVRMKFDFSK